MLLLPVTLGLAGPELGTLFPCEAQTGSYLRPELLFGIFVASSQYDKGTTVWTN